MSALRIKYGNIDTTTPQMEDDDPMTWGDDTAPFAPQPSVRLATTIQGDNGTLTYAELTATVWRLQNEMYGLAAQVVELRERLNGMQGEL